MGNAASMVRWGARSLLTAQKQLETFERAVEGEDLTAGLPEKAGRYADWAEQVASRLREIEGKP